VLVDTLSAEHSQADLLNTFDVHRSTYQSYCARKGKVNPERARLKAEVIAIHKKSKGAAGTRSITGKLRHKGESIGRAKVRTLMKEANLTSKQPGAHRYKVAVKPSDVAENHLNRQFTVDAPNKVWCGDVTYIWSGKQWLYLALVIDLYARRIVGWACSTSPDSQLTGKALKMAYIARGRPKNLMFHSDQGCHYTSKAFRKILAGFKIKQSMSRRGNCWDNAPMERCFRSFKTERMPKYGYKSFEEAQRDVLSYIRYFNFDRAHSYNDYLNPVAAEAKAVA